MRNRSALKKNEAVFGWLFIALPILSVLLFTLVPTILSLYLSLCRWSGYGALSAAEFIGFQNYIELFTVPEVRSDLLLSIGNTVVMMAYIPISLVLSLLLAMALNRDIPLRGAFRVIYYIPCIASVVAVTILFNQLFQTQGVINSLFHSDVQWLLKPWPCRIVIILLLTWKTVGYNTLLYLAGLQGIANDYYEAATLDGASAFRKLINIAIPLLRPTTFFLVVTGIMGGLQIFTEPTILFAYNSGLGPEKCVMTIMVYLYNQYALYDKIGMSTAISWILSLLIFVVTIIQFAVNARRERD